MNNAPAIRMVGAGIGMLLLILDSRTALNGARSAINLIMNSVIPSLFPFFFLSILLTSSGSSGSNRFFKYIGTLFKIPQSHTYLLIPAFLGGYPTGAQAVGMAWKQGSLSKETAEKMLGYCSNAGPSFLFGILGSFFPDPRMCWALWLLHILGSVFAAQLIPAGSFDSGEAETKISPKSLPDVLLSAIKVTATVCGWVFLFRVAISFLDEWFFWTLPPFSNVLLSGLLELTNGCCMLYQIPDIRLRFLLCSVMLSFGGFCVFLQTISVTNGLSLRWYLTGKTMQAAFCGAVSASILYRTVLPLLIGLPLGSFILCLRKKEVAFRSRLLYNSSK